MSKKNLELVLSAICTLLFIIFFPIKANAGVFELSLGASFNSSDYGDGNYEWSRRWGAGIGYHFSELSELEFSFQDVTDTTNIIGFETTTFHDDIYSIDWVQNLTGKNFPIQPYLKAGVGELNRQASGSYFGGLVPPEIEDELTVILGAGLRIYITKEFALRGEATTYLVGGSIQTWQDNYAVSLGLSWFF